MEGRTDTEHLFKYIVGQRTDIVSAIKETVKLIREKQFKYSSLTFLMSDGIKLYAYRDFAKLGDYYTLYHAERDGEVVFCSEKLWPDKSGSNLMQRLDSLARARRPKPPGNINIKGPQLVCGG